MNRFDLLPCLLRRIAPCLIGLVLLASTGCASRWPSPVERCLKLAGDNRPQLEKVLEHYDELGDDQKLEAAQFLIANMEGHGYKVAALYDEEKNEVPFDALDYKSLKEAEAALDKLEAEHGTLDFGRKEFVPDLEAIPADFLIENIDLAFAAWRERPWAAELSFDTFCDYLLPYRGSNEPLEPWRRSCMDRIAPALSKLDASADIKAAAKVVGAEAGKWVRFYDLYYLHPTDQGYAEMNETRYGRCEDISNMMGYAFRANAVVSVSDYTPYWADRDNNHAWEVLLDAEGHGRAGLSNRAAKIYRKMFSVQPAALGAIKGDDEEAPRWLAGKTYKDVTTDYMETTDVTVRLTTEQPAGARFAYICVFNGGEWQAIHWGWIEEGRVTFTKMGRDIAYLPAYYVDKELIPAADPFILSKEGEIVRLNGAGDESTRIEMAATRPETPDADKGISFPTIVVKPGATYELSVWDGGWLSLGKEVAGDKPVSFGSVPTGRLYWLVEEGSRRLERIFTVEDGKQIFW